MSDQSEPQPQPIQPQSEPRIDLLPTDVRPSQPMSMMPQPEAEKEIYRWEAPSRLYKKRTREFYSTVAAIVILLSIILIFAKEFLLVAVILALGFVSYVLASVEPENIIHVFTNKGIRTANKLYFWESLGRFWFEEKWKQQVIHVELPYQFPGELVILVGKGKPDQIENLLSQYLIKEKPTPTAVEKASRWLQEKVPLETEGA